MIALTIHVMSRARVLTSGGIVWHCPQCARRVLTLAISSPPQEVVLAAGDTGVLHVAQDDESWPHWPTLPAILPRAARLN